MKVLLAESAGYCYGVQRAIDKIDDTISTCDQSIYTLGPIIHNRQVIERLEKQGVFAVKKVEDVKEGVIIIRSHGVEAEIYSEIEANGLGIVDATCPYVKNIQKKAEKYYNEGYQIIIIGNKDHPEVLGINGWCKNTGIIIDTPEQAKNISRLGKICIVAQTTFIEEVFLEITANIISKSKEIIIFNTICKATQTRQEEARTLSKITDAMIIIGGYHSSNTQKLVKISEEYCKDVFHIETYQDLSTIELKRYKTIGITAGASTPDWIIEEVINTMEKEMDNIKNDNEETQAEVEEVVEVEAAAEEEEVVEVEAAAEEEEVVEVEAAAEVEEIVEAGLEEAEETEETEEIEEIEEIAEEVEIKQEATQLDFQESIEDSMVQIKPGQIVQGEVILINEEEIMVNIGYKSDGLLTKIEFTDKKELSLSDLLTTGDQIEVMVLSLNDGEGNVLLSKKRVDEKKAMEQLHLAFEKQEILNGRITKSIKGGFIVDLGIKDVFMPISQYHVKYIKDPESVVGEDIIGRIIEYNQQKNRIIFSQRIVIEEEIKEKKENILNSLEEGQTISGKVKSLVKFGAFIDLGGMDGLIHISDLSWGRTNNPEDVLSIGDTVTAMVIEVDREKEKIKLSLKHLVEEPWAKIFRIYNIGDKINVKVVKLVAFGAFAEVIPGVEGLIHKSQISYDHVESIEDYLSVGQEVDVEIIDIDKDKKKIGLSMIALKEKPIQKIELNETVYTEENDLTLGDIFGNLFKEEK